MAASISMHPLIQTTLPRASNCCSLQLFATNLLLSSGVPRIVVVAQLAYGLLRLVQGCCPGHIVVNSCRHNNHTTAVMHTCQKLNNNSSSEAARTFRMEQLVTDILVLHAQRCSDSFQLPDMRPQIIVISLRMLVLLHQYPQQRQCPYTIRAPSSHWPDTNDKQLGHVWSIHTSPIAVPSNPVPVMT